MFPPTQTLNRYDGWTALALGALVLAGGALRLAPRACGAYHDDAIYVSTAQALAQGQGYRLIGVPGAPLQTKYPVFYPAMLAAVWRAWPAFPENLLAMQALTLLCGAAALGLGYLYLVRFGYASRGAAAGAGLLCATAPYFVYFCTVTMAEMPFLLLLVAALWGLERHLARDSDSRPAQFGLGVLLALPFLCRTIGLAVVPPALLLLARAGKPLRYSAAGIAAAMLPWFAWSLAAWGAWSEDPIQGYYTDYVGSWTNLGPLVLVHVVRWNMLLAAHGTAHLSLQGGTTFVGGLLASEGWSVAMRLLGLLPWLAMIPHLRQGRALPWILAGYLAIVLVWPWPPYRFLAPILPFLAAYLLAALAALLGWLPRWRGSPCLGPAALGGLVMANAALLALDARTVHKYGYPVRGMHDLAVAWSSFEQVFAWLREHSQPDDVVASGMDSMISLYTGRPAFRPFPYDPAGLFYHPTGRALGSADDLADLLARRRPRFLVQTPMPGFAEEKPFAAMLAQLQRQHPHWLTPVYTGSDPRFVIYELRHDRTPSLARQTRVGP